MNRLLLPLFALVSLFLCVDAFGSSASCSATGPNGSNTSDVSISVQCDAAGNISWNYSITFGGSINVRRVSASGATTTSTGGTDTIVDRNISGTAQNVSGSATRTNLSTGNWLRVSAAAFGGTPSEIKWIEMADNVQMVSLSPGGGAAEISEGSNFLGQATGAEAGNPYNISIISGQAGAFIDSATGAYVITALGTQLITYKVWASAGGGYERSNDAQASIAVTPAHKVSVKLPANGGAFPINYMLMQGGQVVAEYTQQPGASAMIISQIVPGDSPVTLVSQQSGVMQDPNTGSWSVDPGGQSSPVTGPSVTPSNNPDFPPPTVDPSTNTPPTKTSTSGSQTFKPVWSSSVVNTDPAAQTDLLTNKTYKEGVDKIVEPLTAWEQARADAQKLADDWFGPSGNGFGVNAIWSNAQSQLADVAATEAQAFSEHVITESEVVPFVASESVKLGPDIVTGLPGGTFKLEPFTVFPWLETMLLVIREIILWGMGWMFYAAAQAKLERIQFALSLVPQVEVEGGEKIMVQGNQVPGSSTAVSLTKRLLVAGAIIGTIHIELAAVITAWNTRLGEIFGSGWTFADVGNIATKVQTLTGGPIGTAIRMADTVFPITAGVAYIVVWGLFSWACMGIYALASAAIKAVKI